MTQDTLDYYRRNAEAYVRDTLAVDMTPLYARFLPLLPDQAHILDAGCGSGRDTLAFRQRGFQVTACDASPALAALVMEQRGIAVEVVPFQALEWVNRFDGIWACASLLHVPQAELPDVLGRLSRALKTEGVIYLSFKYGQEERQEDGRHFTDLDEAGLDRLLAQVPALVRYRVWVTADQRSGRGEERWLNALVGKPAA